MRFLSIFLLARAATSLNVLPAKTPATLNLAAAKDTSESSPGNEDDSYRRQVTVPQEKVIRRASAVDDDVPGWWKDAVCKGRIFINQMKVSDKAAGAMMKIPQDSAESKFLDTDELEKWGYEGLDWDPYYDFTTTLQLDTALKSLGISDPKKKSEGENFECWNWEHETEKTIDGVKYLPTNGHYITMFSPKDGVIIAASKYSPGYEGAKKNPPVTVLPKLKLWSDVIYVQWARIHAADPASPGIHNLRYVFSSPVENAASNQLIEEATGKKVTELGKWPGETFSTDVDEGKALLGAPNGVGIGWLLAQHKRQLGNKIVEKVQVFMSVAAAGKFPTLLYHVVDRAPDPDASGFRAESLKS
ncbi:hypothetical protein BDV96DRAFT_669005 [Lophiotrema nucula]|uniref:START domain-containing protein n=1 Tax=Lophiotrema nucula TaxID=690887 RepID=A0A6A5YS22_9PLEO|nr:hypothetical protein BDV96DRAFT_669005 [Lophiotrema nucula]